MAENDKTQDIEKLGSLQFSVEEVALIVGITSRALGDNKNYSAGYKRGRLRAQAEVRKSILQLAKQGSTPAQKQFLDLVMESKPRRKRLS